jgi:subtilisin family serine protease
MLKEASSLRVRLFALFGALAAVALASTPCFAGDADVRVIVKFKRAADARVVRRHGGGVLENHGSRRILVAEMPARKIGALRRDASVAFVEQDGIAEVTGKGRKVRQSEPGGNEPAPSDPLPADPSAGYPEQPAETLPWGIDRVWSGVQPAASGSGVRVAVLDTGIDLFHPDLKDHIIGNKTFVSGTSSAMDDNGHGTHCAGTIGAIDNDIGVVGVAPNAALLAVKVMDSRGSGYWSTVAAGIDWARRSGANIISMSFGGSSSSSDLSGACSSAESSGVLLVAAAGNSGDGDTATNEISYPAGLSSVVSVAATEPNDAVAGFSNSNADVEFAAPGSDVLSTVSGGSYAAWAGTSMATPHVAGLAAVRWSALGATSGRTVRDDLKNHVVDLGDPGRDNGYGYGRIGLQQ